MATPNEVLDHIEIRQTGHNGRWGIWTVFVIDGGGRVFETRQFGDVYIATNWADSWGFPESLIDGAVR